MSAYPADESYMYTYLEAVTSLSGPITQTTYIRFVFHCSAGPDDEGVIEHCPCSSEHITSTQLFPYHHRERPGVRLVWVPGGTRQMGRGVSVCGAYVCCLSVCQC